MRRGVLVAMAGWVVLTGCFRQQLVAGTTVPVGTQVVVTINDRGRAAVADSLGASVDAIEGRLVSRDSLGYTLAISALHLLRGGQQVWSGERVRIRPEYVVAVAERKFARGRTAVVSAAALGMVVILAKSGLAGMIAGDDGKTPDPPAQSTRIPRF